MSSSWKSSTLFGLLASTLATASPLARRNDTGSCVTNQRKEWRTLTDEEKSAYITAEKCLIASPAKSNFEGAVTRWDELQWVHITQSNNIHNVGQFLPWHRTFIKLHETLLQTECNYTGAQPYWDWTKDADASDDMAAAAVFGADDLSFGTNGQGPLGGIDGSACVTDGPFANLTLRLGEVWSVVNHTEYCLSRNFKTVLTDWSWANSSSVEECYNMPTYTDGAWECYSANVHSSVHLGIGGTMSDVSASPGDPLFYLHHANIDRLWWQWQAADLPARLEQMGGQNVPEDSDLIANKWLAPLAAVVDYNGDPANVTTMNHTLWTLGLQDNVTVSQVMDIREKFTCFEYVDDDFSGSDLAW